MLVGDAEVFSVGTHPEACGTKNALALLKFADIVTHRLDYTGEIVTQDPVAGLPEPERQPKGQPEPANGELETAYLAVCFRGFDSAYAYQNLIPGGFGLLDVFHTENIGTTILVVYDCFQLALKSFFRTVQQGIGVSRIAP